MHITKRQHSFDTQYFVHKVRVRFTTTLHNQNRIEGDKSTTSPCQIECQTGDHSYIKHNS